jgi:predicted ester cyclase
MTAGTHTALIQRMVEEIFNQGNLDLADELYTPSVLFNGQATKVEDLKKAIAMLHELIPGFYVTAVDVVSTQDTVAVQWTIYRRSEATARNPDIAKREVVSSRPRMFRITGGKVVEVWANSDALEHLDGLGDIR